LEMAIIHYPSEKSRVRGTVWIKFSISKKKSISILLSWLGDIRNLQCVYKFIDCVLRNEDVIRSNTGLFKPVNYQILKEE
jgi:hypothetical protein